MIQYSRWLDIMHLRAEWPKWLNREGLLDSNGLTHMGHLEAPWGTLYRTRRCTDDMAHPTAVHTWGFLGETCCKNTAGSMRSDTARYCTVSSGSQRESRLVVTPTRLRFLPELWVTKILPSSSHVGFSTPLHPPCTPLAPCTLHRQSWSTTSVQFWSLTRERSLLECICFDVRRKSIKKKGRVKREDRTPNFHSQELTWWRGDVVTLHPPMCVIPLWKALGA